MLEGRREECRHKTGEKKRWEGRRRPCVFFLTWSSWVLIQLIFFFFGNNAEHPLTQCGSVSFLFRNVTRKFSAVTPTRETRIHALQPRRSNTRLDTIKKKRAEEKINKKLSDARVTVVFNKVLSASSTPPHDLQANWRGSSSAWTSFCKRFPQYDLRSFNVFVGLHC